MTFKCREIFLEIEQMSMFFLFMAILFQKWKTLFLQFGSFIYNRNLLWETGLKMILNLFKNF